MSVEPINIAYHRRQKVRGLMIEVTRVLKGMGGSAHLASLIDVLSAQRRSKDVAIPDDISLTVQTTLLEFDDMAKNAADRVFHRPFGANSNRWSLTDLGRRVDQEVEALIKDTGLPTDGPEAIDAARRGVLRMLSPGDKASHIDLTVLDELERRGRLARLKTTH